MKSLPFPGPRPPPPPPERNILSAAAKVGLVLAGGLYLGAGLSKRMVSFLEENEIFIPEEAEDDC